MSPTKKKTKNTSKMPLKRKLAKPPPKTRRKDVRRAPLGSVPLAVVAGAIIDAVLAPAPAEGRQLLVPGVEGATVALPVQVGGAEGRQLLVPGVEPRPPVVAREGDARPTVMTLRTTRGEVALWTAAALVDGHAFPMPWARHQLRLLALRTIEGAR